MPVFSIVKAKENCVCILQILCLLNSVKPLGAAFCHGYHPEADWRLRNEQA